LIKEFKGLEVVLGGRSKTGFDDAVQRRPDLAASRYQKVDITNPSDIKVGRYSNLPCHKLLLACQAGDLLTPLPLSLPLTAGSSLWM
jgi:hypothetical protein